MSSQMLSTLNFDDVDDDVISIMTPEFKKSGTAKRGDSPLCGITDSNKKVQVSWFSPHTIKIDIYNVQCFLVSNHNSINLFLPSTEIKFFLPIWTRNSNILDSIIFLCNNYHFYSRYHRQSWSLVNVATAHLKADDHYSKDVCLKMTSLVRWRQWRSFVHLYTVVLRWWVRFRFHWTEVKHFQLFNEFFFWPTTVEFTK